MLMKGRLYIMRNKIKMSPAVTIGVAVLIGVVVELAFCALIAMLAGEGMVSEDSFSSYAIAISGVTTAVIVTFIWFASFEEQVMLAAIGAAVLFGIQAVCGLLFWRIGWMPLLIDCAVVIGVFLVTVFMLSRQKKSGWTGKNKKRFC